ncbi:hypothetical protein C8R46DRAFT_649755 [Mycena filopes]|nr:hypothetical protein C8R46DRAFT_649755 [Mycena filopes]
MCALPGWGLAATMPNSVCVGHGAPRHDTGPIRLRVRPRGASSSRPALATLDGGYGLGDDVPSLHMALSSPSRRIRCVRCRPYQGGVTRNGGNSRCGDREGPHAPPPQPPRATTLPRTLRAIDSVLSRTTRRMIVQCAGRLLFCPSLSDQRSLRHPPSSAIFIVILHSLVATAPCPSRCNVLLGIVCPCRRLRFRNALERSHHRRHAALPPHVLILHSLSLAFVSTSAL